MAIIPKIETIKSIVENGDVEQEFRSYLGFSGIGAACKKKIWLDFRWVYIRKASKQMARIWERGDIEEERVIRDLEAVGMRVTNTQMQLVDNTGHGRGHIDGIVHNVPGAEKTPHLLEIKTMNSARFKTFTNGRIEQTDPVYWVQMQMYMGYANLTRCLFVVTNKDNEERAYIRYKFDKHVFDQYKGVLFDILSSEFPPQKPENYSKVYYACKYCPAYNYCYNDTKPLKNCRTCKYASMEMGGVWTCELIDKQLSIQEQLDGCNQHCLLENI